MLHTCCRRTVWGEQQGFWEESKGQTSWWLVDVFCRMDNTWIDTKHQTTLLYLHLDMIIIWNSTSSCHGLSPSCCPSDPNPKTQMQWKETLTMGHSLQVFLWIKTAQCSHLNQHNSSSVLVSCWHFHAPWTPKKEKCNYKGTVEWEWNQ